MLLPCSSSTCHGIFSAYIIAHSLILLVVKLYCNHITLFLHRSPNLFPYGTSLSPFSLLIPLLLIFMILLSSCVSLPPSLPSIASLPTKPFVTLLSLYGQESILCPNGSDYSSLFKFISMHLKSISPLPLLYPPVYWFSPLFCLELLYGI